MQAYLVYRFGRYGQIELAYPEKLDATSWGKFKFSGYARGGGIQNDTMGEYSLTFTNSGVQYSIYQDWRLAEDDYSIGVTVRRPKKPVISMSGMLKTQVGSLTLLDSNAHIPNEWR
ncbi:hypothetical protein [Lysobacter arvi]|uniref:Uncharacterized protein n=1 Tax=Lysobacter arvi TaxID=3038776 RepID=A0ABU1CAB6_9GAMM|nr:hypothetical protein [Lysobacter arvi]MDR0182127.1 hypothetical protein [Lysobacter arvi]